MTWIVIGLAAIGAIALFVYAVHRLLLLAEGRGWVYYKNTKPPHGSGALAMQELAQIYEPQAEHVIEATRAESIVADQADSGDEPFWEVPQTSEDDAS